MEMQRESQKDRTILCKYEPTEPGDYRIEVGARIVLIDELLSYLDSLDLGKFVTCTMVYRDCVTFS